MSDTMIERQEQAADEHLERSARYGGTDLFRGVLVLVIAAAVGIVLLGQTPSSPRFFVGADDEAEAVADSDTGEDETPETLDGPSLDEADTGGSAGAATGDDGVTPGLESDVAGPGIDQGVVTGAEEGSTDIFPDATDANAATGATDGTDAMADADSVGDTTAADPVSPTGDSPTESAATDSTDVNLDDSGGRPPADVTVIVLNHTGRKGIAGAETAKLEAAGYATLPAANATAASGSGVYHADGFQAEAEALADVLGLTSSELVKPLADSGAPTVAPDDDISTANIVVVLGRDGFLPTT